MARKMTVDGARKRLKAVRTAIYNLERDLHSVGEDIKLTVYNPSIVKKVK